MATKLSVLFYADLGAGEPVLDVVGDHDARRAGQHPIAGCRERGA